ncbi:hypothetical protein BY458DRAFT_505219 [Sporodiniella umbellata]|nr:hypothetical protein BY458DRAFT_505219 [Sporodiniella umbellata]
MESLDRLNEQQRRTLSQYQSITRSHDIEEAVRILMGNNWNLEGIILEPSFVEKEKKKT